MQNIGWTVWNKPCRALVYHRELEIEGRETPVSSAATKDIRGKTILDTTGELCPADEGLVADFTTRIKGDLHELSINEMIKNGILLKKANGSGYNFPPLHFRMTIDVRHIVRYSSGL